MSVDQARSIELRFFALKELSHSYSKRWFSIRLSSTTTLTLLETIGIAAISAMSLKFWEVALGSEEPSTTNLTSLLLPLIWILALLGSEGRRRYEWSSGLDFYISAAKSVVPTLGAYAIALLAIDAPIHRKYVLTTLALGLIWLLLCRFGFRKFTNFLNQTAGSGSPTVAVIINKNDALALAVLANKPRYGFNLVGVVSDDEGLTNCTLGPRLGAIADLDLICEQHHIKSVLANGASVDSDTLEGIAWNLSPTPAELTLLVDVAYASAPGVKLRSAFGTTVGEVSTPGPTTFEKFLKRSMDLLIAAAALVLAAPAMALVALSILIEDGRPVLFRQARVGKSLTEFEILKFRSMTKNAHSLEADLRKAHHTKGKMWKVENDLRITRVGKVIRATSLDELPQLINVIKGEMSLVGPRPKQKWELADYSDRQLRRFKVKPGITGLSQVSGRSDLTLDEAVELDLEYLTNWSPFRDLLIFCRTFVTVLRKSGAS